MTDTKLLNDAIKSSGLKITYIADCLGISRSALYLKIANKRQFKAKEISNLCELLNIKSLKQKEQIFFASNVDSL